jgi:membrane-associated PAP2 superfamily phosphatase
MTMPRHLIPFALLGALVLTSLTFFFDPGFDLTVAELFYRGSNNFVGQTPLGNAIRRVLYWIPTAVVLAYFILYLARRFGRNRWWAPKGRGVIFIAVTFAIGPGLLANVILKDHSHRPRPYQTVNFGGDEAFRPFYTFDGDCTRNCSFVSGEGATSFWTLAPALLVPPAWRVAALAASVVFALCTSLLRMAFGGHYLSDTIFAALFIWIVIWATWRIMFPRGYLGPDQGELS